MPFTSDQEVGPFQVLLGAGLLGAGWLAAVGSGEAAVGAAVGTAMGAAVGMACVAWARCYE